MLVTQISLEKFLNDAGKQKNDTPSVLLKLTCWVSPENLPGRENQCLVNSVKAAAKIRV